MDLTAIDVFLKLAAELHFGRTAEQLDLPQPRVSRIIRRLEPMLDLFPRVVVVAARHTLARRSSVSIEEIADYTVPRVEPPFPSALMDAFNPLLTPLGKPIRRGHLVQTTGEIAQAVALGRTVHITVNGLAIFRRPDIVRIPVHDMPPLPLGPPEPTRPPIRSANPVCFEMTVDLYGPRSAEGMPKLSCFLPDPARQPALSTASLPRTTS